MRIDRIVLKNFRNFKNIEIAPFTEGLNFFYGANGAGKSNILEAIGLSSLAKSCRGSVDSDLVKFESRSAIVEISGEVQKKKSILNFP
ncbi:MAG: AAA family ATPase [candidate division Zixibacteria bacterium]